MPNPISLVVSLYDKQFMKIHNFRRHIAVNGVQNDENRMGCMQQSSLGPILPFTPCFTTLYLDLPMKMQKNHNNSKSTCHTKF